MSFLDLLLNGRWAQVIRKERAIGEQYGLMDEKGNISWLINVDDIIESDTVIKILDKCKT